MLTGDIRNQIDRIWDAFWSGGISNPLEVIEQITYLLFLRRLDDLHTLEENKSARLKKPMEHRVFPPGKDKKKRSFEDYRWARFKHFAPADMYALIGEHVFPWLRTLGGNGSIDADVLVNGTLAAGNSIDTLDVGNLTLNNILEVEASGSLIDLVNVDGDLPDDLAGRVEERTT